MSKVNIYLFFQIVKYVTLVLFIFLSVAWLLQLTRLFTITNFMNIQIIDVIFLSFYLIPNLITVISPFILIFDFDRHCIRHNKNRSPHTFQFFQDAFTNIFSYWSLKFHQSNLSYLILLLLI